MQVFVLVSSKIKQNDIKYSIYKKNEWDCRKSNKKVTTLKLNVVTCSFFYLLQTGKFCQSLGNPISLNVSKAWRSDKSFNKLFLKLLSGLMMSTIYFKAVKRANNLFCLSVSASARDMKGYFVLYGIVNCTMKRLFQMRL